MDDDKGHRFIRALSAVFDPSASYSTTWSNGPRSSLWSYNVNSPGVFVGTVTPIKYIYNNFDESTRVFTYGKEVDALPTSVELVDVDPIANAVELESGIRMSNPGAPAIIDDNLYHKGTKRPAAKLYGYVNPTTGPGDNCFNDIIAGAKQYGHTMLMVLDNGA